jgi:hypothetical protein
MDLRIHLKICEACGCLWYRAHVETGVYCAACNLRFKEFPTPQSRKRRGRPKRATLPTVFAVQASAQMIFEERHPAANNTSYVERAGFTGLKPAHGSGQPVSAAGRAPLALLASETGLLSSGVAHSVAQLGGAR